MILACIQKPHHICYIWEFVDNGICYNGGCGCKVLVSCIYSLSGRFLWAGLFMCPITGSLTLDSAAVEATRAKVPSRDSDSSERGIFPTVWFTRL